MNIEELEKYYDKINHNSQLKRDIEWGLRTIPESMQRDLLELYRQEGIYFYQNVAPRNPNGINYSKEVCEQCLDRLEKLAIQDLTWTNVYGTKSNAYLAMMNQTLRFHVANKSFTC